ncbi:FAD-dependent monooxygenase [Actinoalloteichus hymeniacidonis]|uniref:2-polyprenyl-6-methoxyphenol hydroxylase-like oxidoreductase n=1 Tax=Actinoalloteichus hymeniacidonis TaxID=340345 RepID=A0AAC9HKK9_9PSEU|nr:FAD-dependent monooxygenase [Actinoalloteichus hymeniacidonis]AOS60964.1 2-polyprenyl-6-methoxyphenol hydroxylase-like oxidoreductase [Actinoalloteichus hymeniacidonis]MBB5911036.1 2-polyprenyl-6-methoxyphenol hydroxylase-like FAD-dependent oxidoreductase [Actinoalloteichus hymeniacidonis]
MDVVIVGGGPNGMMLAGELALAGVRPIVLERLSEPSAEPRSNGLAGQVVRMIDRRGLFERLGGGPGAPEPNTGYFMFAAMPLHLGLLHESPLYNLAVPELRTVQVLEERATELGADIRRGHELIDLTQDADGVTLTVARADAPPYELRARYVVGADSAHSPVRKAAGIGFPGVTYDRSTTRTVHAVVPSERIDPATGALIVPGHEPIRPFLPIRTDQGGFSYAPFPGGATLIATVEWDEPESEEPMSFEEMQASVRRVLGAEVELMPPSGEGPHLLRRLHGGNTRVAERYRNNRVFLVGDAAHVFAAGGTGLNLGLQDAINLGWKLAAALDGTVDVLDTYETERRPVAERTTVYSQAQSALLSPGEDVTGLRQLFGELLTQPGVVQVLADLVAGADVRYPVGEAAHPLAGWPVPDLTLYTSDGMVRLAELARAAKPLLIDLTEGGDLSADGVEVVRATAETEITALLVRPDSYVAWASSERHPNREELAATIAEWFGVRG